ncbi:hypothetical protein [Haloferax marisrubri]|uniref:DUF385 domain-containing protein n=1 Tax=Haloferax marisrubri TaxID=1544719 RepID=A0A2P4NN65_9EURY|nr:hypothetical protein [Haloferax marisrubri]POG54571.1 hypothetical protein AUR65_012600 [Haloferax marisrubri]
MSPTAAPHRVSDAQRTLEQRFANPFLRRVLRSPLHRLASRWFVLVSYVGPKSGRRYWFPVAYAVAGGGIVAVTPKAESNWWKNFRRPMACRLWYRGQRREATGEVVTGEFAADLLDRYAAAHGLLAGELGISETVGGRTATDDGARDAARDDVAVVLFRFD